MKTIGMIGGMSWESSLDYYRYLNEIVKQKLGGLHSAQCLLYSVDFDEIEVYQRSSQWHLATEVMVSAAQRLERGARISLLYAPTPCIKWLLKYRQLYIFLFCT